MRTSSLTSLLIALALLHDLSNAAPPIDVLGSPQPGGVPATAPVSLEQPLPLSANAQGVARASLPAAVGSGGQVPVQQMPLSPGFAPQGTISPGPAQPNAFSPGPMPPGGVPVPQAAVPIPQARAQVPQAAVQVPQAGVPNSLNVVGSTPARATVVLAQGNETQQPVDLPTVPGEAPPVPTENVPATSGNTAVLSEGTGVPYMRNCRPRSCANLPWWSWPAQTKTYISGEYLYWTMTGDRLPPLVTTGTPGPTAGVLGAPGTSILFGDQAVNNGGRSGTRLTMGWWLNEKDRFEVEWFMLATRQTNFNQASDGSTVLAQPFYNLATSAQDSVVVGTTGVPGYVSIRDASFFNGAAAHLVRTIQFEQNGSDTARRVDAVYGFRYFGLYENLTSYTGTSSNSQISTFDQFRTSNTFYGGDIGLMSTRYRGRWSLSTKGLLGIGVNSEHAHILGYTTAGGTLLAGGVFAQPSNHALTARNYCSLVPQLNLKLAYALNPKLRLTVGYDLLYWGDVARPGDQISTNLNFTQSSTLTGPLGPKFLLRESNVLVQGLSTGIEFRY